MKVDLTIGLPLDGVAGNATTGINHALTLQNGPRRTMVDAGSAGATAGFRKGMIVAVTGCVEDQFAEMDKRAVLRRNEERLAADPAQSGLDSPSLFGHRRRVDKGAPGQAWTLLLQHVEHVTQHRFDGDVVILIAGVGGDLRAMVCRVALADRALVAHCAYDDGTGIGHKACEVEPFFGVALQVAKRCLMTSLQPSVEASFLLLKRAHSSNATLVKSDPCSSLFDTFQFDNRLVFHPFSSSILQISSRNSNFYPVF